MRSRRTRSTTVADGASLCSQVLVVFVQASMPSIRQVHALHRVFGVDPWRFLRLSRPLVPEEPIEETHKPHVVFVTFLGWDTSLEAPEEIGPFLVEFPTELLVVLGREFCLGFLLQFRLDVLEIAQLLALGRSS